MRCIRLNIHSRKCTESTPYCFCSICKEFILDWRLKVCPYCGHKFTHNDVETMDVTEKRLGKKGFDFFNIPDYIKGRMK